MKRIPFMKMAGAGNDFIVVDAQKGIDFKRLAVRACDRTHGIGADGLLILDTSPKADYRLRIINRDGSEAEMCGNGARCMAAYIARTRKPKKKLFSMDTLAGFIRASAQGETARVNLNTPVDYRPDIALTVAGRPLHVSYIDTGVPHTIVFVDGLERIDVKNIGRQIRCHQQFKPRGTNVDFVEQINDTRASVRTYERGVEDETKSCGTGSVAAAIVTYLRAHPMVHNKKMAKMKVQTIGKEILEVTFDLDDDQINNVWLKGSARFIAKGEYFI